MPFFKLRKFPLHGIYGLLIILVRVFVFSIFVLLLRGLHLRELDIIEVFSFV